VVRFVRRDVSTTARGTVTAYVRVAEAQEDLAVEALNHSGFYACRDDGDPDRPPGTRDIYVSRHYGMTNPDPRTVELHHVRVAERLKTAGVAQQDMGGGVVWGLPIDAGELSPVSDARTMEPTGYMIHAATPEEVSEQLHLLAETLGLTEHDLVVDSHATEERTEPA
jgi:hypothetical protein